MLGTNPSRSQELGASEFWIQEVFYTLQGEGPFSGQSAVFVRLAGCNLRCFWCDTDFESSTYRPDLERLLGHVDGVRPEHCDLVVLTGGEPFRQNIGPLVTALLERGLRVQIESSGTLWVDLPEHERLTIVCSPKTPKLHRSVEPRIAAFKYVIAAGETDPADGLPIQSTQMRGSPARIARPTPGALVYVMPRDDRDAARNLANMKAATEVAMTFGYRLTLQVHKIAGIA